MRPVLARFLDSISSTQAATTYQTSSGQTVTSQTPFELVAVRAAINVLAQDVAALPLKLYRHDGRSREEVITNPLATVLRYQPNPRMSAYEWREALMVSLLIRGNAYGYIQRDGDGRCEAIYPLRPEQMKVELDPQGLLTYTYQPLNPDIPEKTFTQSEMLHVKGLSSDGLVGRAPLTDFREKLGEIAATERFTQAFYGNGMKRSAVLKHKSHISDDAHRRLRESMEKKSGADKAFSVLILEEDMDFNELTFAPEDAQLLDSRRFSVEDVCRIYNLPPYKLRLNEPGAVSYASVDSQRIDYLISSLTPWLVRIEQGIMRCCMTAPDVQEGLFVEHNTRALLRSDLKSQAEALEIGRRNNWYSVNECRAHLGENPVEDPRADDVFAATGTPGSKSFGDAEDNIPDEAPPVE
jgi:HK97 family phage portal protein